MSPWTEADIPDQSGKIAVVTGANSGIGFETARALVEKGATVVLACRDEARGEAAVRRIERLIPEGRVRLGLLDLADLDSVKRFAEEVRDTQPHLDLLINNAGVMMPPLSRTAQGFELQLGVNHLGHFALTGMLFEHLLKATRPRVVTVSSQAHRQGSMDFDDLQWERKRYRRMAAYGQSKLANLLFTFTLKHKLEEARASMLAVAAHPGWTATNLQKHWRLAESLNPWLAMDCTQGALPTLRAATDPSVASGDYFGPDGLMQMRGHPTRVGSTRAARNVPDGERLWAVSQALTGSSFPASLGPVDATSTANVGAAADPIGGSRPQL